MILKRPRLTRSRDDKNLEEKIVKMKRIVYKTLVDESTVKLLGERMKSKLFAKMGFLKPKPDEIQFESIEKFYDPFFIINARYSIDYYRKHVYKLRVGEDVSELVIFNQVLKPKTSSSNKIGAKERIVELEADQRIIQENSAYMVIDRRGREVKVEDFPTAPAEEKPGKALAEAGERVWEFKGETEKAIGIVRSRVVERPKDLGRTTKELLEVSEYNLVYVPVYQATYRNAKTWEQKTLLVNGVTSKPIKNPYQTGNRRFSLPMSLKRS